MSDSRPTTSEDLIREARNRLQESRPELEPQPETTGVGEDRPVEHVYRSQMGPPPADEIPDSHLAAPVEYAPTERPWYARPWVRWVVIAVAALGYWLFTTIDNATRDESGQIVERGDLDVMTIQVGDCFDDPSQTDVVYNLDALPCSQPHDNEVFAVVPIAGVFGTDFPGQSVLEEYAYGECSGSLFDDFVGTPYLESSLDVFTLTPSDESWAEGDREIVCALYRLDLGKLTGTARDSDI